MIHRPTGPGPPHPVHKPAAAKQRQADLCFGATHPDYLSKRSSSKLQAECQSSKFSFLSNKLAPEGSKQKLLRNAEQSEKKTKSRVQFSGRNCTTPPLCNYHCNEVGVWVPLWVHRIHHRASGGPKSGPIWWLHGTSTIRGRKRTCRTCSCICTSSVRRYKIPEKRSQVRFSAWHLQCMRYVAIIIIMDALSGLHILQPCLIEKLFLLLAYLV